ncbi:hypothetical protein [Ruthenibacterium lactatiformans]|uniref:Uncharacterized protein n=1 Tax=Ruthenibacterium lactatiformans TaxID=1550024 RepID=A0A6I3Q909_9FIRM|nr:hypothetical protein [Ruthenibacterium lactatiformans]MTS15205.1 hypothetical protein [Ruthenibacterium lactatiformans]MTS18782.1 hypothetical protein [Ruthenibacterium lactatiformans]MTS34883.1 hypothetical protein [Ruthenibacterium lactatiformans]MTS48066.1 hypothetical protein [Ruthenibacterium lactatiformans]MTS51669.1 hypothetical protein [Ruthenibacterium lactatiformans]
MRTISTDVSAGTFSSLVPVSSGIVSLSSAETTDVLLVLEESGMTISLLEDIALSETAQLGDDASELDGAGTSELPVLEKSAPDEELSSTGALSGPSSAIKSPASSLGTMVISASDESCTTSICVAAGVSAIMISSSAKAVGNIPIHSITSSSMGMILFVIILDILFYLFSACPAQRKRGERTQSLSHRTGGIEFSFLKRENRLPRGVDGFPVCMSDIGDGKV